MYKPANPIRRNIINKLLSWTPTLKWANDPMADAHVLIQECRSLVPYVTVMYYWMSELVIVRKRDDIFLICLNESLPIVARNMRTWLFTCPHLQEPVKMTLDAYSNPTLNSKIRYGFLADSKGTPKIVAHFEFNSLTRQYPHWLGMTTKSPRIADIAQFINQWGGPLNRVSQRGRSKEDRYAFIYPFTGKPYYE